MRSHNDYWSDKKKKRKTCEWKKVTQQLLVWQRNYMNRNKAAPQRQITKGMTRTVARKSAADKIKQTQQARNKS